MIRGGGRLIIEVSVVTKSPCFSVSIKDGRVRIHLTSPPEKGQANAELVRELRRATGADVRIISGLASRRKRLEIGMDEDAWNPVLQHLVSV